MTLMATRGGRALILASLLACAMLAYVVPVALGYGWNAQHAHIPQMVGSPAPMSRTASGEISIEHFGTGIIEVGLSARINEFVRHGELPLWNPRQGLGQPFAAMGEGDPFWPPRVMRALLPYPDEIFATLLVCAFSGLAMFGLLRLLNASFPAAALGACMWITSGSLSMHLARPNIFDQVAMLPVLFFGIALVTRLQTVTAFLLAAFLTAAFAITGFPQIAAAGLMAASAFAFVNSMALSQTTDARRRTVGLGIGAIGLGLGLAAFYLMPLVETVLTASEPRTSLHGYLRMPWSNLVSFFFPLVSGQPQQNWMPGGYPDVTDWNNLYGHSSVLCLFLLCIGLTSLRRMQRDTKFAFLCFFILGVAFYLKYISLPPFSLFNRVPVLGTITPKHVNGVAAFLFAVAAGLAIESLPGNRLVQARRLLIGACLAAAVIVLVGIYATHGSGPYDPALAAVSLTLTLGIFVLVVASVTAVANFSTLSDSRALTLMLAVIVAEGVAYLLLGNSSVEFIWYRLAVVSAVFLAGFLVAMTWRLSGYATGMVAVGAYAALVAVPDAGLPRRVDLREPAAYMRFVKSRDADGYRTFGINADYSGVGGPDDLSVAGPFAPKSFRRFVEIVAALGYGGLLQVVREILVGSWDRCHWIISASAVHRHEAGIRLAWRQIRRARKKFFVDDRRSDEHQLFERLSTVYDDALVAVLESSLARPKAEFYASVSPIKEGEETTRLIRDDPSIVERSALVPERSGVAQRNGPAPFAVALTLDSPNELRASLMAPSQGILVVKQAMSPGWRATLNSKPAESCPSPKSFRGSLSRRRAATR